MPAPRWVARANKVGLNRLTASGAIGSSPHGFTATRMRPICRRVIKAPEFLSLDVVDQPVKAA